MPFQSFWRFFAAPPLQMYREELLRKVEDYPTLELAPFLEAARIYWNANRDLTPPRTCYAISRILSRRGNEADLSILKEMVEHPNREVGFVIAPDVKRMEKRLDGSLKPTEWVGRPPDGYDWDEGGTAAGEGGTE